MYLEIGTGIDNIFKFFAVDFIWRVLPTPLPEVRSQSFGIFFRVYVLLYKIIYGGYYYKSGGACLFKIIFSFLMLPL